MVLKDFAWPQEKCPDVILLDLMMPRMDGSDRDPKNQGSGSRCPNPGSDQFR